MWPNLFIIGAAKAGTTSLHYYLSKHPDVHMSVEKEPNFFLTSRRGTHSITDPQRYQALFDTSKPVRGEASVSYSFWPYPAGVPQRIYSVAPAARFIYLVRDPIDRIVSHYRHRIVLGEETRSLAEVAHHPEDERERYITGSRYATQLEQYLQLFPLDHFLILDHHDLLHRRGELMRQCFTFLGVDDGFTSASWERLANETSGQRQYSELANRLRHSTPYRRTLGWFNPELRDKLLAPARQLLTHQVSTDVQVTAEIRAHYAELLAPEAERFRRLTDQQFSHWSV